MSKLLNFTAFFLNYVQMYKIGWKAIYVNHNILLYYIFLSENF